MVWMVIPLSRPRLNSVLPLVTTKPAFRPAGNGVVPATLSVSEPASPSGMLKVAKSLGLESMTLPALEIEQPKRQAPPSEVVIDTAGAVSAGVGMFGTPQSKLVEAITVNVAVLLPVPPGPAHVSV